MTSQPAPLILLLATILALGLAACSRSPKEQLAFQHAEQQYQLNQLNLRNAEQARSREDSNGLAQDERARTRD
ncbi:MAG TPA: hypothetical protein VE092_18515 [Herbaspirillum sp.]|uniref:hypothetical protein n=1 Tax=Herbaspirillum sp. TaxID=1890675 RepID=UPI002D2696B8|nr:hypothetical protein [Herbaspirillum sp.]HZG22011.1 hypothetical protein [Herbaspirillum sp.]